VQLHVRISAADGTSPQTLQTLVERGFACAPVSCAMRDQIQVELRIECEDA